MIIVGRNTRLEVQKTLGSALPVSAVSNDDPGVVSFTGAAPADGDVIILADDVQGMEELSNQVGRVASVVGASPKSFELEGFDTTSYGIFDGTSSFRSVTAWSTLAQSTSLEAGSANLNKLDATTLLNRRKRFILGQPDVPDLTVNLFSDPLLEAQEIVTAAADTGAILVFRATLENGSVRLFAGQVSLPTESIQVGQLVTGSFQISQQGNRLAFAS